MSGLYLVPTAPVAGYERCTEAAVAEGVRWVQLRMKDAPQAEVVRVGRRLVAITRGSATRLIVNAAPVAAAECDADGVHLGQGDLPLAEARRLLPPGRIVGLSTHDEDQAAKFSQLKDLELKVARAWAAKELFSKFWEYQEEGWARRFFKDWFGWVSRSRLQPVIEVAQMLKRHLDNLLTYLKHHITNAVTEGLNSKIQNLKSAARGFRNFRNYRIRILFFCGKLNLYPL